MSRKMVQIDQISCFLHNTKNITCITSWNRNSSGETIKTSRNLLEISAQVLNVGSLLAKSLGTCLTPNHELWPGAGGGAARTHDQTLTLPCQKCWVILRYSLGKLETHSALLFVDCSSFSLLEQRASPPFHIYWKWNQTKCSKYNMRYLFYISFNWMYVWCHWI